jgi:Zn-dependent protease with chaperone function
MVVGRFHRQLPPRAAAWLLSVLAVGCGLAVFWAALTITLAFLAAQPLTHDLFGWCRHLAHGHDHVPLTVGVLSGVVLVGMLSRAGGAVRRYRELRTHSGGPVRIVTTTEPLAVTLPGRRPQVLISTGMLICLQEQERPALYAHELAHAHHRHHRFLLVGDIVTSAVPPLGPLANQVAHALERWADEDAAIAVGDRRLVATAIARAAIAVNAHEEGVAGMAGGSAPDRVRALLTPRRSGPTILAWSGAAIVVVAVASLASSVQLHHLVTITQHLC